MVGLMGVVRGKARVLADDWRMILASLKATINGAGVAC